MRAEEEAGARKPAPCPLPGARGAAPLSSDRRTAVTFLHRSFRASQVVETSAARHCGTSLLLCMRRKIPACGETLQEGNPDSGVPALRPPVTMARSVPMALPKV